MTENETDAARRDRTIAECNALRQYAAELRGALHDLYELVEMDGSFENRDIEPYKYDAIVDDVKARARALLAKVRP